MFNYRHYVPVLRWKGAERKAVRNLRPDVREYITPLLEIVPKQLVKKSIESAAKEVAESWGWNRLVFVDFLLLADDDVGNMISRFAKRAASYNIEFALTTGLLRTNTYQDAVRDALQLYQRDLCLRLFSGDFRSPGIETRIEAILSKMGIEPSEVHLILDFQTICGGVPNLKAWMSQLPMLDRWLTTTVISGAFPKDLSELDKNAQHLIPRHDLDNWNVYTSEAKGRKGAYGDYTIQHGIFEEREGKQLNFSASLRYAGLNDWVVMRGEGVLNEDGPGYSQWPAQAQLLCERTEFSGEELCYGDAYIKEMSLQGLKTGTAKEWLAATINHHLTLTALQVGQFSS